VTSANDDRRRGRTGADMIWPEARLDLTVNPYGPSFMVMEALAGAEDLHLPAEGRADTLRERLAAGLGVGARSVLVANGIDRLLLDLFARLPGDGPLVVFPPTDSVPAALARQAGLEPLELYRTPRFETRLDRDILSGLPVGWCAYVQSPNDPSGTSLTADEAVRLARGAEVLIIDERHGAYSPRNLLPLAREFDNVVIVRTFETWAGLAGLPLAYAVVPARLRSRFMESPALAAPAMGPVIAGLATLDDLPAVLGNVRQVRSERARLYRMLRKLNMVSVPYPTWSNFLLVRAERTTAPVLIGALARRGVRVAPVDDDSLRERTMRISAGRPGQTDLLRRALIEIGVTL